MSAFSKFMLVLMATLNNTLHSENNKSCGPVIGQLSNVFCPHLWAKTILKVLIKATFAGTKIL